MLVLLLKSKILIKIVTLWVTIGKEAKSFKYAKKTMFLLAGANASHVTMKLKKSFNI